MYIITLSTIFYISYSDTNLYILQLEVGNILLVTYSRLQVLKEVLSLWRQYKKDLYLKPQSLRGGKEVKKRKFVICFKELSQRRGEFIFNTYQHGWTLFCSCSFHDNLNSRQSICVIWVSEIQCIHLDTWVLLVFLSTYERNWHFGFKNKFFENHKSNLSFFWVWTNY